MTIFSTNSIFQPIAKFIKFINNDLSVINGVNNVNSLPLCNLKINYEQYQRISVQVPKSQIDYVLSFPMLGINTTFIAIKPTYCGINPDLNYLKWKFQSSSDAKWSFTNLLILTGTSNNPIPPILIDNPNPDCTVILDILVSAMDNDYLNDTAAFIYLQGLTYDCVHTYNETNSGILAFFNATVNNIPGSLVGTVNIIDIVNVSRVPGLNRIIIDEASQENIVLDFLTDSDTTQALSAINWVLADPINRLLPQPKDIVAPVITYTNRVNTLTNTIEIDLSTYSPQPFAKTDFINAAILSVIDSRDGVIIPSISNIVLTQSSILIATIVNPGTYTANISISDIAGNITTAIINITALSIIVDTTPPVFNLTPVIVSNATSINISDYVTGFSANDAKVLCILAITDDVDGMIPLSNVVVVIRDISTTIISSITTSGIYTLTLSVQDAAHNTAIKIITLTVS